MDTAETMVVSQVGGVLLTETARAVGLAPPAQRAMSERAGSTVAEVAGSHAIYLSQPTAVAALIEQAAAAAAARQMVR